MIQLIVKAQKELQQVLPKTPFSKRTTITASDFDKCLLGDALQGFEHAEREAALVVRCVQFYSLITNPELITNLPHLLKELVLLSFDLPKKRKAKMSEENRFIVMQFLLLRHGQKRVYNWSQIRTQIQSADWPSVSSYISNLLSPARCYYQAMANNTQAQKNPTIEIDFVRGIVPLHVSQVVLAKISAQARETEVKKQSYPGISQLEVDYIQLKLDLQGYYRPQELELLIQKLLEGQSCTLETLNQVRRELNLPEFKKSFFLRILYPPSVEKRHLPIEILNDKIVDLKHLKLEKAVYEAMEKMINKQSRGWILDVDNHEQNTGSKAFEIVMPYEELSHTGEDMPHNRAPLSNSDIILPFDDLVEQPTTPNRLHQQSPEIIMPYEGLFWPATASPPPPPPEQSNSASPMPDIRQVLFTPARVPTTSPQDIFQKLAPTIILPFGEQDLFEENTANKGQQRKQQDETEEELAESADEESERTTIRHRSSTGYNLRPSVRLKLPDQTPPSDTTP